jgi:hypothetical protein
VEGNLREEIIELRKGSSALLAEILRDDLNTPESSQPQRNQIVAKNPKLMSQTEDELKSPEF